MPVVWPAMTLDEFIQYFPRLEDEWCTVYHEIEDSATEASNDLCSREHNLWRLLQDYKNEFHRRCFSLSMRELLLYYTQYLNQTMFADCFLNIAIQRVSKIITFTQRTGRWLQANDYHSLNQWNYSLIMQNLEEWISDSRVFNLSHKYGSNVEKSRDQLREYMKLMYQEVTRAQAFALGTVERTGQASPVRWLNDDALQQIWNHSKQHAKVPWNS